ncbi:MAG: flagellin [Chitinivibrionales bacterium]|nr:flagellin [Chitinivibrionales bacterium]
MRINHNISSMVTQGALFKVGRDMGKSLERLSTGLRINRASDDAAGLGVSENLRTQVRGSAQAQRNAQDGVAALQIAEGAANEISSILQRMRELSIQAANDTLTSVERGYTQQEFGNLQEEINRIAAVTNYNGMELISSTSSRFGYSTAAGEGAVLWIDANNTVGTDSITIAIGTLTTNALGSLDSSSISEQSLAVEAISVLDGAIDSVNTTRADIGAYVNRLEHAVNNLIVSETNQQAAESMIRDVDFATETTAFTKNQILTQSATAMLAQSNMIPSSVLGLVSG